MVDTFIFRIIPGTETEKVVRYQQEDYSQITPSMWQQLADDITRAPTLFPSTAAVLARRCQTGYAAIAVFENRIVSHIALAPIIHSDGCAPSWEALTSEYHLDPAILPAANIYASACGWTAPEWRGHGINLWLRKSIYRPYLAAPHLGLGGMVGLAQPLLAQLGWRIIAWDRVPFISSLVSIPASEFPLQSAQSWHPPHEKVRYQGEHVGLNAAISWEKFVYLWASDAEIAAELDRQVQTLVNGDLQRWRSGIVAVFTEPNSMWRVAFDNG